ncbi:MAG: hypothetical protein R3F17_10470 [Planctomycetota bacterium]
MVLIGDPGPIQLEDGLPDGGLMAAMGLEYSPLWVNDPLTVQTSGLGEDLIAYEGEPLVPVYWGPLASSVQGRVWRRCHVSHLPDTAPVCTVPAGGVALNPFLATFSTGAGDRKQHLNLVAFLREALGREGLPVPDPNVINGRRAFFAQIDGDGFESLSTIEPGEYSAKVFRDRVLKTYALPFTVSYIIASLTDRLDPDAPTPAMELARDILTLPNVEAASHTILHPLEWNEPMRSGPGAKKVTWYPGLKGYQYSPEQEVRASIAFINRWLCPPEKPCEVMLWSGDAVPPTAALAASEELGLANVNGGTYRWDDAYNSRGYVRPTVRWHHGMLQVYCGMSNENMFDGYFGDMPRAFIHIDTTIERTGEPILLKPANVYMHFYGAERPARLKAMQYLLDRWGLQEETTPIFASDWWRIVRNSLLDVELRPEAGGVWHVRNASACRTLRFDGDAGLPDLSRCEGVLGFRRWRSALYVHLGADEARVVLQAGPPTGPWLEQASFPITAGARDGHSVRIEGHSVAARHVVFAGLPPGESVSCRIGGSLESFAVDTQGRLQLDLPPGDETIEVSRP